MRVLVVWVFCATAIAFWAGVVQYATGFSAGWIALAGGILALAAIPFAGHIAYIVWEEPVDG